MNGITHVAMVDDHNLVRKGLVSLVNSFPDYKVVLEAAHGGELLALLPEAPPIDIAIVDLNMPFMDGFATITALHEASPHTRAIALTFDGSEDAVIKAMRTGARGFLRKDVEPDVFKLALDRVRDTGYYESELVKEVLSNSELKTTYERQREKILAAITDRELEIIRLACSPGEFTYEEIAHRMNLKPSTVEGHRKHIFDRFGIKSKAGLVIFAYRWEIVRVDSGNAGTKG